MPPDLSQAARPLAELPSHGCGEAATDSPQPPHSTAEHNARSNGGRLELPQELPATPNPVAERDREGQVGSEAGPSGGDRGGTSHTPPVNMYLLSPALRAAFAPVGADNRAYSFREVLLLLKKYLFSKVHLFDPKDRLYVNCGSDPLGVAFKVDRFHYNDVRLLITQNIIRVQPEPFITVPVIPNSSSDTESVYSVQGYETEYCRNTEPESSEEDEVEEVNSETFEEYELPSDDARDEEDDDHSSENDSTIDDVEIAVLAYTLLQDEVEEGFWADDSDTDDQSNSNEDSDPELVSDRWNCLTCGLRNDPFVRYCGKCWQLRKNWLPDRPKKRKRKPRPKKRNLRNRTESIQSEDQFPVSALSTDALKDQAEECVSVSRSDSTSQLEALSRTTSTATTVSLGSESPERSCYFNSQDSGISLSQDMTEECGMDDPTVKAEGSVGEAGQATEPASASCPAEASNKTTHRPVTEPPTEPMVSSRKRKSSDTVDFKAPKKLKSVEGEDSTDGGSTKSSEFVKFLETSVGAAWLNSPEGKRFLTSPAVQESVMRLIEAKTSAGCSEPLSGFSTLCSICCLRPKNASIIHGSLSHQATCYQCARKLLKAGARCPVCRRKIHMVCKHIIT